jgi:general secretion pathway protein I
MKRHSGFSLLEVLMAFAIMAVAITIVLRIFGAGVNNAMVSEDYSIAVQMAESLLARTGTEIPLQPGETSGNEANKYQWLVNITQLTSTANTQGFFQNQSRNQPPPPSPMFLVKVQVFWGDGDKDARVFELSTMKSL